MWKFVDDFAKRFTVKQLSFILIVLLICIGVIGPYKLASQPKVVYEGGMTNTAINPTRALEECPIIPPNYDLVWSWCHGSHYKVCKANYPYDKKTEDFLLIIERIGKIFDRHRIKWWIDFNTLRSAVVEGRILPWDYQLEVSIIEKRFRQYYPQVMEELHQCTDPNSPLYYKRFSGSDLNLRGKFQIKWEPRFWIEITPWNHDEKKNMIRKAGWGNSEKEQQQIYTELPYDYIHPIGNAMYSNVSVPIPAKVYKVLNTRFGHDEWKTMEPPSYYRPDLRWGSDEMRKLK